MNLKQGNLFIISGPSGVGKGTIKEEVLFEKKFNFHFSVSSTTRKKRTGETNGKNYHFILEKEFLRKIKKGEFIEWVKYAGNYYGTLKSEILNNLNKGKNVFLEIEVIGMKKIVNFFPRAVSIFILPPSIEELERRLTKRSTDSKEDIKKRLKVSIDEIVMSSSFRYKVVNNKIEDTIQKVKEIISSELYV